MNGAVALATYSDDWRDDCAHWMGRLLTGVFAHWCPEWDDLPIDETCGEFAHCTCFEWKEPTP